MLLVAEQFLNFYKPVVDMAGDVQCCVHTGRSHTRTSFI